jgi:methylenetetrahydrofolate--tRNA-(uracil-5-)-methyltransferase
MNSSNPEKRVHVVGAGLAGSEAAWVLAEAGFSVLLYEMRPQQMTEAHKTPHAAELVCSNTFKSMEKSSAHGLIKEELKVLGSFLIPIAETHRVPAGSALAVDREAFSKEVTARLKAHPKIQWICKEVTEIPKSEPVLLAPGPLAGKALLDDLKSRLTKKEDMYFYDALSPILSYDSLDFDRCFQANRYGRGQDVNSHGDYINCPMEREEYETFIDALLGAEKVTPKNFEELKVFEGCMPVEVLAERGRETLRFGPMKPVGLKDPKTGELPWAVLQLRRENEYGTAWNMVGFQTRLKYGAQLEVFRKIPALKEAEFYRLGSMHRNSFINAPSEMNASLSLKSDPMVFLAGQITGVEGYTESVAGGLLAAKSMECFLKDLPWTGPSPKTALGSLYLHLCTPKKNYQPSNINFGMLEPLPPEEMKWIKKNHKSRGPIKKAKKEALSARALKEIQNFACH